MSKEPKYSTDLPLESHTELGQRRESEDSDFLVFSSTVNKKELTSAPESKELNLDEKEDEEGFFSESKTKYSPLEIEDTSTTFSPYIDPSEIEDVPLVLSDDEDPNAAIPNESMGGGDKNLSRFTWQNFIAFAGPGWLTSIAYMDPGNLEAGIQAAALCGNRLLWALLWSHALALFVQNLSSRIGCVTGKHLSQHIRNRYPPYLNMLLYFMVEVAIIGSDIQMVISTAIALNVLFRLPHWIGTLICAVDILTFFFLRKVGTRKLETVYIGLIGVMAACFIAETVLSKPEIMPILEGVAIPYVPQGAVVQAIGMFGSVIMPHNFYLNSGLVSQRKIERSDPKKKQVNIANKFFLLESAFALMGSFFINSCVVIVFSQVFYYSSGRVSRDDIGLGDASQALQNVLGNAGPYIWGVGLLASAQSTTVTGTLAGQYVLEGFWNLKVAPWKRLLGTRVIAIIPSFFVAVLANSQLDMVGEYLNAIQSIQLPFVLIPILKIAADRRVMGKFTSPLALQIVYWIVGVAVVGMNAYSLVHFAQTLPLGPMMYVLFCGVGLTYIVFISLLCFHKTKA